LAASDESVTEPEHSDGQAPWRWPDPFRVRSVWVPPLILVVIMVLVITLAYIGSAVNPAAHLHGLSVAVVNQDAGATVGAQRINLGDRLTAGLSGSRAVTSRLAVRRSTLAAVQERMDEGKTYAAVVIPPNFSASLAALAGIRPPAGQSVSIPKIELLTNPRAGTLAVSLASGVLDPALAKASHTVGGKLLALDAARAANGVASPLLADPVTVSAVPYRPLPSHSALGLSAFYVALLTTFCGFLGAVVVNTSIDAVLGYATTEIGPVWRQRKPVQISRWHTLLAKWIMAVVLTAVLIALMLLAAVLLLSMDAPHVVMLWLLCWFAAAVIAIGTLVLFAALGTLGQLIALLVFVYLALASSGGTVPLNALSGFFRFFANFEPLGQILDGTRAILYFGARGVAGLTRAWVATGIGFVFWVALGAAVTTWYDRKRLYRMPPELMRYVDRAVADYGNESAE
jgi:YhgE/Pip-like protein